MPRQAGRDAARRPCRGTPARRPGFGSPPASVAQGRTQRTRGSGEAVKCGPIRRNCAWLIAYDSANGPVPVHQARLASVRIGDVQVFDVEATVVPMQMEQILLGNSFLARFQMRRENDTMTLVKRY